MVTSIIGTEAEKLQSISSGLPVGRLQPQERFDLSVQMLGGQEPVSRLAHRFGVSRKTAYRQAQTARDALQRAFDPSEPDDRVQFYLPVTKTWVHQLVLAQVLIGHTSYRGVGEILEAVFDLPAPSVGTIHNILAAATIGAGAINRAEDLSGIRVGAHDEIYQGNDPVLVGIDVKSLYCYLLAQEDHADETTWGVHLLDLASQGLAPDHTIADAGRGLRAGQRAAWPTIPCHGDVFHPQWELGKLAGFLEHRAAGCVSTRKKLERQMGRSKRLGEGHRLSRRLAVARQEELRASGLAQDVRLLADWMTHDILSLAGPSLADRRELFDFVVQELVQREGLCPHRIRPVRRALQQQRDDLLAFAAVMEEQFADLAARLHVPLPLLQQVCQLQGLDRNSAAYWQAAGRLQQKLGGRLHSLQQAVVQVMAQTARASSLVENLNSRLRCYFFLRRDLGDGYLELLRFFLNHRRFLRSECPQRVGKSPAELLSGRPHAHWLELLGFPRFHRN